MSETTGEFLLNRTGLDIAESLHVLSVRQPTTWADIADVVQNGDGAYALPIGTQIMDTWGAYTAPWTVVHHASSNDLYLSWHNALPTDFEFDAPEAIYYAGEGGLAAGTYHIGIGVAYGSGWATNRHIQFTLTRAMDKGDQLVINCGANPANDPTNRRTWRVYHAGDTTSLESGTTSNGTAGTALGTIGAVSLDQTNGQLNAISRVLFGYGRWSQSALRQYLNSDAAAGAWWTPKNGWDRPPARHKSVAGFLANGSAEFRAVLRPVKVVTVRNAQEGFAEDTETTWDRIFLPSLQELYIETQQAEGEAWQYYQALAAEAGLPGRFPQYAARPVLKKYPINNQTTAVGVWLRSCSPDHANGVRMVDSFGLVGGSGAFMGYHGCPACVIQASH